MGEINVNERKMEDLKELKKRLEWMEEERVQLSR